MASVKPGCLGGIGVAAAAGVASALVYLNALPNGFVFDDYQLVVENPLVTVPFGAWIARLVDDPLGLAYRPLRTLSYALDYRLGGLTPWVFHLSNILYHSAATVCAVAAAIEMTGSALTGLIVGVVFGLHPVQSESVAYVSGRRDVLCGLFYLLAFFAYLRWRRGQGRWGPLVLVAFAAALLSKEMAVSFPAIVLAWELLHPSSGKSKGLLRAVWLGAVAVAVTLVLYGKLIVRAFSVNPWYGGSLGATVATAGWIWWHYLNLLVWPAYLSADYSYDAFPVASSLGEGAAALVGIGALVGGACWLVRRAQPAFGVLWIALSLLPVSHLIPHREMMAEHYLYIPVWGFGLIVGGLIAWVARAGRWGRATAGVMVVILAVGYAVRTYERNQDWFSNYTLWRATVQTSPRSARARFNFAVALLQRGREDEALHQLKRALAIAPRRSRVVVALGELYLKQGKVGQARALAERARRFAPDDELALNLLGWIRLGDGEPQEALSLFRRATRRNPRLAGAYAGLGKALEVLGRPEEAGQYYKEWRRLAPGEAGRRTHSRYGVTLPGSR